MGTLSAYIKLLRIPGIGALAMPPVVGALTLGITDFYDLSILFFIGAFAAIYGFVLNDYADVELDKLVTALQKKPLVSGEIKVKHAITVSVICILFAFFLLIFLWRGSVLNDYKFLALLCLFLAGLLGSIYNLYGKKIIASDFLVAISISFILLMGALSFGKPTIFTWIVFILSFNQTLHMNAVEGGIKDADHDYKMGVHNLALTSGVKVDGNKIFIPRSFQSFSMFIRLFSVILVFIPFFVFDYSYELWQLVILAIVVVAVLYLSIKLIRITSFDRTTIQKYIGMQSFLRYSIVPLMLISIIGLEITLVIIIFPIVWYMILTVFIGEKLFRPRM